MSDALAGKLAPPPRADRPRAPFQLYCAVCGQHAAGSVRRGVGHHHLLLKNPGWLISASRRLHAKLRTGPAYNCLCPACLADPSDFTRVLLRAWVA